ncbi:MAG TPA: trehalose-6-phosphate synthase [Kofleriaceae bacterium]
MNLPPASRLAPRRLIFLSSRVPEELELLTSEHDGIWLGWSGRVRPSPVRPVVDRDQRPFRAYFDMAADSRERFGSTFCHRTLWPLLHGLRNRVHYTDGDWDAYARANDTYARHAIQLATLDAAIWVHDYDLMLAGQALRRLGHRGPIGHVLNTPFPARELFETLPWSRDLIEAMLAFDLLGFRSELWADNFRAAASRLLRVRSEPGMIWRDGHATRIGVFPQADGSWALTYLSTLQDLARRSHTSEEATFRRVPGL